MSRSDIDLPALDVTALARVCVRYPGSTYPDLLARAATRGHDDAPALRARARRDAHADTAPSPTPPVALKARLVAGFAWAQAGLLPHGGDVGEVADLLALAHRASGARRLPPHFADLWLDALFLSGAAQRFPYPREREVESRHWRVAVDEMNPFLPGSSAAPSSTHEWLAELSRLFTQDGASPLELTPGLGPPLHRLTAGSAQVAGGPLVSVVMPAFDPGSDPPFALRSILRQSHTRLEVLLCDDGSGPRGREVLARWAELDPRVRLLRRDDNGGAYAARNLGLSHARGDLVTFQDIDDWSHPERLARQTAALRSAPDAMATVSRMARVDDDLGLTVLGYAALGVNASSLMFRRRPVLMRLGGFDSVRRAGDNEFLGRLRAAFGPDALVERSDILALVRRTRDSLSRNDHRLLYRDPARAQYRACYRRWHEQVAAGQADPLVRPPARIPVPARAHLTGATPNEQHCTVAVLASPAGNAPSTPDLAAELAALVETGRSVAVVDFPAPFDVSVPAQPPAGDLLDLVNGAALAWWSLEDRFRADLALVRDPAAVIHLGPVLPRAAIDTAVVVADYMPARHYDPVAVERLLGQAQVGEIRWLPATEAIASALAASVEAERVSAPRRWGVATPGVKDHEGSVRTVRLGVASPSTRLAARDLVSWAAATLPRDPQVEVWCRSRLSSVTDRLDRPVFTPGPPRWPAADFLRQVSHLVLPPTPGRGPHLHREAVTALRHDCVLVLDPDYRQHFGPAALYTDEGSCQDWMDLHRDDPGALYEQRRRAHAFLHRNLSPPALRQALAPLLP